MQLSLFQRQSRAASLGLLGVLVLAGLSVTGARLQGELSHGIVDIGVEHTSPLSLRMEFGVRGENAFAEFSSESDETVLLSVPSSWVRHEVRSAPIETVTAEPPSLGLTRWTLPPHAGISFSIPEAPLSVVLHNPSGSPLKLSLAYIDLETGTAQKDVLLIQDDTVKLW